MTNIYTPLAKSALYGEVSLRDHSEHVDLAIVTISNGTYHHFDPAIAHKGAILHDLGKAHPHFQHKIRNSLHSNLFSKRNFEKEVHRHEISSLAFLPVFPKSEWPALIEMVVAHHKSIKEDPRAKGILDIASNKRDWIDFHLQDWETWMPAAQTILIESGLPCSHISIQQARNALEFAHQYCEEQTTGWSRWRGLLKAADHFASAFNEKTAAQCQNLFSPPDLSYYRSSGRKNNLYPLSVRNALDDRPHTIVTASTGAGKTDFLLRRCRGRIFYTLPFQASINAMWERFSTDLPDQDIRLLHASSRIVVGNNIEEQILQPLVGSAIKVMTPHQLAAIIFGTSGFETIMLDVEGCDIILDEIHTYSDVSSAMVLEIANALVSLNCRIHIGTATMPSVLYNRLLDILGGPGMVEEVKLTTEELDSFDRHQVFKHYEEDEIPDIVQTAINQNEKLLIVCNTVKQAQHTFEKYLELFPDVPGMLIHSRFKRGDRSQLEQQLKKKFNGDGIIEKGLQPCIVVATQVVEVSLDISFDRMITQCAPLDSLIQRFGRINRVRNQYTIGKFKPVHVLAPSKYSLPYKKDILEKSFAMLPENGDILHEADLQGKIDKVYPSLEEKTITAHLRFIDGDIRMKKLTDQKKSILIEALEIEGVTCILQEDEKTYENATWQQRFEMEIPVSWKSIRQYQNDFHQLKIGSFPFVIPQNPEQYKKFGLIIQEPDNLL